MICLDAAFDQAIVPAIVLVVLAAFSIMPKRPALKKPAAAAPKPKPKAKPKAKASMRKPAALRRQNAFVESPTATRPKAAVKVEDLIKTELHETVHSPEDMNLYRIWNVRAVRTELAAYYLESPWGYQGLDGWYVFMINVLRERYRDGQYDHLLQRLDVLQRVEQHVYE